jgi:hypothetical protein
MKACQVGAQKVLVTFHTMPIHSEKVLVDRQPSLGGMKACRVGAEEALVVRRFAQEFSQRGPADVRDEANAGSA